MKGIVRRWMGHKWKKGVKKEMKKKIDNESLVLDLERQHQTVSRDKIKKKEKKETEA